MAQTMEKNMDMVRQLVFIVSCFILLSCKAQKDVLLYDTTPFDISRFEKHKDSLNDYKYYTGDSTYVMEFSGNTKDIFPKGSLYKYQYQYRKDGSLHKAIKIYPNHFILNIVEYDSLGKMIKDEYLDKDYTFTFEKVQEFIKSKGLELKDVRVVRGTSSGIPRWSISWHKKENYTKGIRVGLDGRTGETLYTKKINYNH